jgi:hypothetical protein
VPGPEADQFAPRLLDELCAGPPGPGEAAPAHGPDAPGAPADLPTGALAGLTADDLADLLGADLFGELLGP